MVGKEVSEIIIDCMLIEHLPEILEIEKASFQTPWSETLFYNEISKSVSLTRVAIIDGKIVGYICANLVLDEGQILNIAVHPLYRKQHIASRLVDDILVILKAHECRSVFLEVRVSNDAALKIYEKVGFQPIGTRKKYYVSPVEDALLMVLKLK